MPIENVGYQHYQPNVFNIQLLNRVRFIAIPGQLILVFIARFYLDIQLPLSWLFGIIFCEVLFQLFSYQRIKVAKPIENWEVFTHILIDSLILAALIYFSGGANNPFTYLLFLFIALGTLMLSPQYLMLITAVQLTLYSLLHNFQRPLNLADSSPLASFHLHMAGMWVNFALTAILIAIFGLVARNAMLRREKQIHELREKQLKDEQILSLGIMASGAAHELGTPLSTMAIIVDDIQHDTDISIKHHQDMKLLAGQIENCRNIIQNLSDKSSHTRKSLKRQQGNVEKAQRDLKQQLQLIIDNWLVYRPQIKLVQNWEDNFPSINFNLSISVEQAVTNLMNNAADASLANGNDSIELDCQFQQQQLIIEITDFGNGLTPKMRSSLGANIHESKKADGLGWGLFLSNASIELVGGKVHLLETSDGGTLTRINLPIETSIRILTNE